MSKLQKDIDTLDKTRVNTQEVGSEVIQTELGRMIMYVPIARNPGITRTSAGSSMARLLTLPKHMQYRISRQGDS